jgi:hypothetical protein
VFQENGSYGGWAECENTSRPKVYEEEKLEVNEDGVDKWMTVTKGYGECTSKPEAK